MKAIKIIKSIFQKETVLCISLILAVLSMFIITPSKEYISYIDFRTLAILICMMIIMAGLEKLYIFQQIGEFMIGAVNNIRSVALILILLCFFFSMLITNDVALLTFIPFTVIVLNMAKKNEYMIKIIVLETVAANLGSMLLPMGNPQNLYLYSLSGMNILEFILLMIPYATLSLICICAMAFILVKKEGVSLDIKHEFKKNRRQKISLTAFIILFFISLLVVMRVVDYRIGFLIVVATVLIIDWKMLITVDYSLIFTFVFLFVFIGNLKQVDEVSNWLYGMIGGREIIVSVVASQVISNVPAAILLSAFTERIKLLIIGTNIGGLGTLIASMASLISFKIYSSTLEKNTKKYILQFTAVNIILLCILLVFSYFIS